MKNLFNTVCFFVLLVAGAAFGHSGSTAFMELNYSGGKTEGEWLVALVDMQAVVNMDVDYDNKITYREFSNKTEEIREYLNKSIAFSTAENACSINWRSISLVKFHGGVYVKSAMNIPCDNIGSLRYTAFFDLNKSHRAILKVYSGEGESSRVFTPSQREYSLDFSGESNVEMANYLKMGVVHILEGLDHLLFLVALLVPAIFSQVKQKESVFDTSELKKLALSLIKIVTAFTLGHSVTLILASVFSIKPPGPWVETIIAASVVLAGVNIVFRMFSESCWKVAVLFGLVHGFGFAGALVELGLNQNQLFVSLLSFNVGVEIGQLLVVLLVTPVLILLAQQRVFSRVAQFAAGGAIACFGLVWLIERVPVRGMLQLFA